MHRGITLVMYPCTRPFISGASNSHVIVVVFGCFWNHGRNAMTFSHHDTSWHPPCKLEPHGTDRPPLPGFDHLNVEWKAFQVRLESQDAMRFQVMSSWGILGATHKQHIYILYIYIYIYQLYIYYIDIYKLYAQTGTFADPTVQRFELFFPFEAGVRFFFWISRSICFLRFQPIKCIRLKSIWRANFEHSGLH